MSRNEWLIAFANDLLLKDKEQFFKTSTDLEKEFINNFGEMDIKSSVYLQKHFNVLTDEFEPPLERTCSKIKNRDLFIVGRLPFDKLCEFYFPKLVDNELLKRIHAISKRAVLLSLMLTNVG